MEIWTIVLIIVLAVILVLLTLAYATYRVAFWKRYDKNPLLKYFTAEDFNLTAENIEIGRLRGAIYKQNEVKNRDEIVIFVHGMGAGHIAYTTEIAYFCNLGYTVVAVDSLGCALSGGKRINGMYEGVKTAFAAIDYTRAKFPEKAVYLVGHSWGGYSVLCASARRKVEKVVAISAPNTPVRTLYEGAAKFISKPVAAILCPFWWFINFLLFGANGNKSAIKCARKNGTQTLLIHGDEDKIVTASKSVFYKNYGENVTKYLAKGKAHNPYNTVEAEKKLAELQNKLATASKMPDGERTECFTNFDYAAATEEDEVVMNVIAEFLM
ncbi:MAG: lysophospholipase [Clostridia bacterium]|nr:lysophospholipase [Clostridia bacterium]